MKLTKLQVAERQLMTAIKLWSEEGDVVSVHALVGASLEVLDELAASNASGRSILRNPMGLVREDKIKEFRLLVRRPQNFFKHADNDLHGVLDFDESVPELFLIDALSVYEKLKGAEMAMECRTAFWGLILKNEAIIAPDFIVNNAYLFAELRKVYSAVSRREFVYLGAKVLRNHLDGVRDSNES